MVGDEDADVFRFQAVDDALDVLHGDGVHAGKRFVEHDEPWVDGQAACNLATAALAARQPVAQVFAHLVQVQLGNELLQPLVLLLGGGIGHLQHQANVVLHTQRAEHRGLLRQVANAQLRPLVHGQRGDVHIVEKHPALVGGDQACGHVECGGLAGAVGAEQAHNLALAQLDGHMVHHRALAVLLHQVAGGKHQLAVLAGAVKPGGHFFRGGLALLAAARGFLFPGQLHRGHFANWLLM